MASTEQIAAPVAPLAPSPSAAKGLAGRAVRGGAILMATRLGVQAAVWGVTLYVARLLTPGDYGMMTAGMIFVGLADMLAEAGVGRALIHKKDLQTADIDAGFTLSLALSAGLYAGLWLLAGPAGAYYDLPGLPAFLRVLALSVLTMPFRTVAMSLLDRDLRLGRQAALHIVCSALNSGAVLALALAGAGYWALAGGALLGKLLEAVTLTHAARWMPRLRWPGRDQAGLVWFGLHAGLSSLLWYVYTNCDFAIVGKLSGEVALGYYALAFQLISIPVQKLTANTNQVVYPVFCRLHGDRDRLRDWYLRLTVLLGFLGVPTLAGMALVAPDAFPLILGEKWVPAVLPFQMLAVVGILMVYFHSLPPLFNALGRPEINVRYTAACAVLYPLAFLVGGLLADVVGVCVAWLVLYPVVAAVLVHLTRKITGVGLIDLLRAQLPVVGAAVGMAGVVVALRSAMADASPWLRLVACIAAGAAAYAGVMLAFARHTVLADVRRLLREFRGGRADA